MNKVYQIVLDKIIYELNRGIVPWHCPWDRGMPCNYVTKRPYSGINMILLGMLCYRLPYFLTRNQIIKLDGNIKKGERSNLVIYYKPAVKEKWELNQETGEKEKKRIKNFILRYYFVYNIEQTTLDIPEENHRPPFDHIKSCELIYQNMPKRPELVHEHQKAYYSVFRDVINMPRFESFESPELYYGTLFHELIHSTGHNSRLYRKTLIEAHAFGDALYSEEEMIAELGAAYLSAHVGIDRGTIQNSASYINGWLKALKRKPRFLFSCSSKAKKAVEYIVEAPVKAGVLFILISFRFE